MTFTWYEIVYVGLVYYMFGLLSGVMWRYADDLDTRYSRNRNA